MLNMKNPNCLKCFENLVCTYNFLASDHDIFIIHDLAAVSGEWQLWSQQPEDQTDFFPVHRSLKSSEVQLF